ncbi:PT domain-containing protein [Methanoregula sp.]|uniref:PT domain-containing protein n=1 Tax=Methanoregula sp. TaxID=2052170 RepID=UPI00356708D0
MEKIQIQFNESDYKIYFEYCYRYYQIHDIIRKKSILTFLELFCNGVLPVEEEDITQAHLQLFRKHDELKKASYFAPGDTALALQVRSCGDILIFCKDLEKMYRLFLKQGITANYLIILGTFSKVIEEAKKGPLSDLFDFDAQMIESLASPLAEIIRKRLGNDPPWQSVLHELTVITARFNQLSTGVKFDLELVKVVAPPVVFHFTTDVDAGEILSAVPAYYDDSELEEFETLLNRTYDLFENELDSSVDWEKIAQPLNAILAKIAEQREHLIREHSTSGDRYLLAPHTDIPSFGEAAPRAGALITSFTGVAQKSGHRVFEIDLSREGTTQIDSPITVYPATENTNAPAIAPFLPMIIGILVILLFIFGTGVLSGAWDPSATGNSSTSAFYANGTAITKGASVIATTVKPTATSTVKPTATPTAKPTATPNATPTIKATTAVPVSSSYSSADVGNHLVELAFGPDTNVIQKPTKDLVWLSIMGADRQSDETLIADFISQFNDLSTTTKLSTNLDLTSEADITLVLLPESSLQQIYVAGTTKVYKDPSTGTIYAIKTAGKTYVNSDLRGNARLRWVLRAVLINLGFVGETTKYPDSLFYAKATDAYDLNEIDLKALELMYGKKVKNGMTKSAVKALV